MYISKYILWGHTWPLGVNYAIKLFLRIDRMAIKTSAQQNWGSAHFNNLSMYCICEQLSNRLKFIDIVSILKIKNCICLLCIQNVACYIMLVSSTPIVSNRYVIE